MRKRRGVWHALPLLHLILLLLLAPAGGYGQNPPAVPDGAEWDIHFGNVVTRRHIAVSDRGGLDRLFAFIKRPPGMGKIDFSRQMLVAICLGMRPTTGYGIRFESAGDEGKNHVVRYEEVQPWGRITGQALTQPCLLKVLPRTGRKILFEMKTTVRKRFPDEWGGPPEAR